MTTGPLDGTTPEGELLWDHLLKISELVQRSQSRTQSLTSTTRNSHSQSESSTPLEKELFELRKRNAILETENAKLKEDVVKLADEVRRLNGGKEEGTFNLNNGFLLTQETDLSGTSQMDETEVSPFKPDSQPSGMLLDEAQVFHVPFGIKSTSRKLIDDNDDEDDDKGVGHFTLKPAKRIPSEVKRNRLIEDYLNTPRSKRVHARDDGDEDLRVSDLLPKLEGVRADNDNLKITPKSKMINFSQHPIFNRSWYPEDFIKNPEFEKHISDRSVDLKVLPPDIRRFYIRQKSHLKAIAMKKFKDFTNETQQNLYSDPDPFTQEDEENDDANKKLITPAQDPEFNYNFLPISSTIKFEINKTNYQTYLQYYPNILKTSKVRVWDIGDSEDAGDVCGDFLLTQEVQQRNEKARERAKMKALQMLFQACFNVKNGKQVGSYVFKRGEFNEKVCDGEFVISLDIFQLDEA